MEMHSNVSIVTRVRRAKARVRKEKVKKGKVEARVRTKIPRTF